MIPLIAHRMDRESESFLVCVADADGRYCEAIGALLSLEGLSVIAVSTADELSAQLCARLPSVLILDAAVAGARFAATIDDLRRRYPGLAVIVTVPHTADSNCFVQLVAAGAWTVFAKPIDAGFLISAIHRCHLAAGAKNLQREDGQHDGDGR